MMKRIILFILCGLTVSCGPEKEEVQFFERPVKTITVESALKITSTFSGIVSSKEESDIGFKMGGEITKMNVEDGQVIKKGDLIAVVDNHDYVVQYDAAKASFLNSKSQIERYEKLYAKEAISQQDYEIAQTNYAHSEATFKNAEKLLSDTELFAPFSGIIEKRYVNQYQRVMPSEPVVRLINPEVLEIDFTLPIKRLKIIENKTATYKVVFDNYPNFSFNAKVFKVVNSSPDGSGIPVTLTLDDSNFNYKEFDIKSGFSCDIIVSASNESKGDNISIPLSTIYYDNLTKTTNVWIYDADTKTVNEQKVVIGELQGHNNVLIRSGLKQGDVIVSAGVHQIVDGQKVKLIK